MPCRKGHLSNQSVIPGRFAGVIVSTRKEKVNSNHINQRVRCILVTNLLAPAQLWAMENQPSGSFPMPSTWIVPLVLLALAAGAAGLRSYQKSRLVRLPKMEPEDRFSQERITGTFIAALPSLSRELNLEIATSEQTEVLERNDAKYLLGIPLGTNTAQIHALVTYRYHIRLYDPWLLENKGQRLVVHAPVIRASQPPAIHTDQMEALCVRGWCRLSPTELAAELQRDLTPTLVRYAEDPRRIELVRESARQSIAEFVRLWLEGENCWNGQKFTSICVTFGEEKLQPSTPTLQLTQNT